MTSIKDLQTIIKSLGEQVNAGGLPGITKEGLVTIAKDCLEISDNGCEKGVKIISGEDYHDSIPTPKVELPLDLDNFDDYFTILETDRVKIVKEENSRYGGMRYSVNFLTRERRTFFTEIYCFKEIMVSDEFLVLKKTERDNLAYRINYKNQTLDLIPELSNVLSIYPIGGKYRTVMYWTEERYVLLPTEKFKGSTIKVFIRDFNRNQLFDIHDGLTLKEVNGELYLKTEVSRNNLHVNILLPLSVHKSGKIGKRTINEISVVNEKLLKIRVSKSRSAYSEYMYYLLDDFYESLSTYILTEDDLKKASITDELLTMEYDGGRFRHSMEAHSTCFSDRRVLVSTDKKVSIYNTNKLYENLPVGSKVLEILPVIPEEKNLIFYAKQVGSMGGPYLGGLILWDINSDTPVYHVKNIKIDNSINIGYFYSKFIDGYWVSSIWSYNLRIWVTDMKEVVIEKTKESLTMEDKKLGKLLKDNSIWKPVKWKSTREEE